MKIKWRFVLLAGCGIVATLALGMNRTPQPPSFCDQCVMQRNVVEWRFAGRWKVFETASMQATPVSELLQSHQACPAHEHSWSVPRCVPEAELETSEAPRIRSIGFLNAPRSVNFLRSLFDYTDAANLASWRQVAWQADFASALEPALRFSRFPENGFASRAEFLKWWDQSSYPLFNRLHAMTVAD